MKHSRLKYNIATNFPRDWKRNGFRHAVRNFIFTVKMIPPREW